MPSRWRRFWRVFFMLEKPRTRHWVSKGNVRRNPELRHLRAVPPTLRERARAGLPFLLIVFGAYTLYFGAWWALRGILALLELDWRASSPSQHAQVTARMELAMRVGFVGFIAMQIGLMVAFWFVATRLHLGSCRRILARRGVILCLRCGYEPGSWTDRCPECGRPIARPQRPHPRGRGFDAVAERPAEPGADAR